MRRKSSEQEVQRARELLENSLKAMPMLANDRARMSLATLVTTQRMVLDSIARRGYAIPLKPIVLTMPQKLRALPSAWRVARKRVISSLARCTRARENPRNTPAEN
jgi:hypothetical protein